MKTGAIAVVRAGGAALVLIGGASLVGWHTGHLELARYTPGAVPLQYNTSVSVALLGAAIWLTTTGAARWSALLLAFPLIVPALTLAEHVAGIDLRIDRLLFEPGAIPPPQPALAGRMAPNSAVSLVIASLAVWCMRPAASPVRVALVGHASAVLAAIGFIGLAGYVFALPTYAWGPFTPMSLPAAVAVAVAGTVSIAWTVAQMRAPGREAPRWLPLPTGIAVFAATVIVWQALIGTNRTSLALIDDQTAKRLVAELGVFAALAFAAAVALVQLARGQTRRLEALNTRLAETLAERERAVTDLSESEERFRGAFDGSASGMAIVGLDLRFLRVNAALCAMLRCRADDIVGRHVGDFCDPEDAAVDRAVVSELIASEIANIRQERRYRRGDGELFWALVTRALVRDAAGQPLYVVTHVDDIEARKRSEERLKQQADELAASNAELEQFAYIASHDLQEPLRMVSSYTQLLARRYRGRLDADADEFIAYAVDGAHRMQQLIQDLLAYSRVGRRGELQDVDLNEVCASVQRTLGRRVDEVGATLVVRRLPVVRAVAFEIEQVLQNLVGNALKFHSDLPPRVEIDAVRENGAWRVSVRDNGIGIAPEYAPRIFLMFQRLHSRDLFPGNGIGLALCKKIVERHGGRIGVDSRPGEGSTFWFTVPAREEQSHAA